MKTQEAINRLKNFNDWQRYDTEELISSPTEIGTAIDHAIEIMKATLVEHKNKELNDESNQ